MHPDLFFNQQVQNEDLTEQFADYGICDLHSNLLKLIQTNIVYSYCESLVMEEMDCAEEKIAKILDYCQAKDNCSLYDSLPFEVLLELKRVKSVVKECDRNRQAIIDIILNLIVENTLLRSSLMRFAHN